METKEQTLVWETLNDEQIRESIAEIGLGEQLGMFDQIDALNTILRCRRDIASLRATRDALVKALESSASMLGAVAGDIEDGYSLASLRGKYVMALVNAWDAARTALAQAREEKKS